MDDILRGFFAELSKVAWGTGGSSISFSEDGKQRLHLYQAQSENQGEIGTPWFHEDVPDEYRQHVQHSVEEAPPGHDRRRTFSADVHIPLEEARKHPALAEHIQYALAEQERSSNFPKQPPPRPLLTPMGGAVLGAGLGGFVGAGLGGWQGGAIGAGMGGVGGGLAAHLTRPKVAAIFPEDCKEMIEPGKPGKHIKLPEGTPRPGGKNLLRLGAGKPAGNSLSHPFSGNKVKLATIPGPGFEHILGGAAVLGLGGLTVKSVHDQLQQPVQSGSVPLRVIRNVRFGTHPLPGQLPYGQG